MPWREAETSVAREAWFGMIRRRGVESCADLVLTTLHDDGHAVALVLPAASQGDGRGPHRTKGGCPCRLRKDAWFAAKGGDHTFPLCRHSRSPHRLPKTGRLRSWLRGSTRRVTAAVTGRCRAGQPPGSESPSSPTDCASTRSVPCDRFSTTAVRGVTAMRSRFLSVLAAAVAAAAALAQPRERRCGVPGRLHGQRVDLSELAGTATPQRNHGSLLRRQVRRMDRLLRLRRPRQRGVGRHRAHARRPVRLLREVGVR